MAAGLKPTFRYHKQIQEGKIAPIPGNVEGIPVPFGVTAEHVMKQRDSLPLRPSDVFVDTYPKCGTTWMQQIVKLIVNSGVETGMDIDEFCPWMIHMTMEEIEAMASPRFFKTHMPYNLIPGGDPVNSPAKYIYVIRNPKDVVVSVYHFGQKIFPDAVPPWDQFIDQFISGDIMFGAFHTHLLGWWSHKDSPNVLIITFENMKKDPRSTVSSVASFLGHNLSDEVIESIVDQTSFDKMKHNPAANISWLDEVVPKRENPIPFIRKGKTGGWRSELTEEQSARIDTFVAENFASTGLVFDYGNN